MTITVVTGTPGAGKTLLAIEKLLLPMVGTFVPEVDEDTGQTTMHPRTIYTNINGLLIDHELVQADGPEGLHNWHEWAKPGAVIVVDEFQKVWPPRPNGSKVPDDIQAMDTHRHMGVDFILICQNVMNADRHIHGLTNRHLHVRRMGNMRAAIVYEWDHCSRTLMFSKCFVKKPWRYDKKVFKLYKSARVHTKQPRSLPGVVWFILVGAVGFAVAAPTLKARLDERVGGKNPAILSAAPAPLAAASGPTPAASAAAALAALVPASGPAVPLPVDPTVPVAGALSGCGQVRDVCRCYDGRGVQIVRPVEACRAIIEPAVPALPGSSPFFARASYELPPMPTEADIEVREFMRDRRSRLR